MKVNPFKSHLLWFLVAGAAIFGVDALRDRADTIIVDESVAHRLTNLWLGQMGREPTPDELANLLENWLDEEILYREALKLELDTDDIIIRRRLVQKIEFIATEAANEEPDEEALYHFFKENLDGYMLPTRYTFSQLMFREQQEAVEGLQALNQGESESDLGAPGMLSPHWSIQTPREIVSAFGGEFALHLARLSARPDWQGPLPSAFGWHLVRLQQRFEAGEPEFDEVRGRILTDYLYEAQSRARETFIARTRDGYQIEWQLDRK